MKKILVTGGKSRFAKILKQTKTKYRFYFKTKKELNILSIKSIEKNIKKIKPDYLLHLAGLSRPMVRHDKNINLSLDLNIIGTANVVKVCQKKNIKIIYFSTNYIYPGRKGNYKETDPLLPWNNYGWSKLGGECSVQMYKNSLIVRVSMTEKPFIHKSAFTNVKNNFIFQEDLAQKFIKLIDKKGIKNLGGKSQSVYDFARKYNKDIKKRKSNGKMPNRLDMSLKKFNKIFK